MLARFIYFYYSVVDNPLSGNISKSSCKAGSKMGVKRAIVHAKHKKLQTPI